MKKIFIFLISFLFLSQLDAQYIVAFNTENDDSFREWNVELEMDSTTFITGKLGLTWGLGDDFTAWQYSIGEFDGEIVQKFANNPAFWELRQDGEVVTIIRTWPNDPTQWKIKLDDRQFTIKSKYGNTLDQWEVRESNKGDLFIFTEREGDARDWLIEDYMSNDIPFIMRMAAVFISIYSSSPKT
ncbi:MAG: hypothetical protein ACJATI_004342 [Halioglobus sp.]|jgi:hypothetical protein